LYQAIFEQVNQLFESICYVVLTGLYMLYTLLYIPQKLYEN